MSEHVNEQMTNVTLGGLIGRLFELPSLHRRISKPAAPVTLQEGPAPAQPSEEAEGGEPRAGRAREPSSQTFSRLFSENSKQR